MLDFEAGAITGLCVAALIATLIGIAQLPAWVTPYLLLIAAFRCWWVFREREDDED
jgi:Flp pilus assembly protein TadB